MNESLSDKLRSFGVPLVLASSSPGENQSGINPSNKPDSPLSALDIDFLANQIILQRDMNGEFDQSLFQIDQMIDYSVVGSWAKIESLGKNLLSGIIFLDTETTGLAGGTGTLVFLVGIGYFLEEKFYIKQFFLENPAQEKKYLLSISKLIDSQKTLVTYNGGSFDIPLLKSRFIINKLESPFTANSHFDLLRLTRKLWRESIGNCSLSHLEWQVLGSRRSQEDVPGWLIPEIYRNYLQNGDETGIKRVIYHNAIDVMSLAGLFKYSCAYLTNPAQFCKNEFELFAVASIYQDIHNENDADTLFEQCFQNLEITPNNKRLFEKYGQLCKKNKKWNRALAVWKILAEIGSTQAMIDIAKYYEHFEKNYFKSLFWTDKAIQSNSDAAWNKKQDEQLTLRKNRLSRRLRMNENN